ncbi:TetR/AcrR family transcriptional regulator [Pseudomonas sp. RIT-PI-S]|uniref:TetR/AcrR family transcriptional regulator n=1 Tax=Pseudomonas sp. RIT-PI-S TaxID=3035295 RepID=UPI0021DA7D43|nr:TetR/AcrR family transcriptional regulator [Pseudomonas sp. RIT-PI-S]
MAGLRARQKEQRREAIVGAARVLFETHGFMATTVEQIAVDAGVSTPTVFNYFGSKQEILLALVQQADRQAIADARQQMPAFDDPVDALCHLERLIVQHELAALPASIWREVMALGFSASVPEVMVSLNEGLVAEIACLLQDLQAQGKLGASVDVAFVAYFLNDYCSMLFMRLVQQEVPDLAAHAGRVRQLTETVFRGLAPR